MVKVKALATDERMPNESVGARVMPLPI